MKTCRKKLHQYNKTLKQCPECKKLNEITNKDKKQKYQKERYEANKQLEKVAKQQYYIENKTEILERNKKWKTLNPEKHAKQQREYHRQRKTHDRIYKLKHQISSLILTSYKRGHYKKSSRTHEILGCSIEELDNHLIATAMSNYGSYINLPDIYHIDHIIPISSATSEEEVLKLNHYSNLQLLYSEDNLKKSNYF